MLEKRYRSGRGLVKIENKNIGRVMWIGNNRFIALQNTIVFVIYFIINVKIDRKRLLKEYWCARWKTFVFTTRSNFGRKTPRVVHKRGGEVFFNVRWIDERYTHCSKSNGRKFTAVITMKLNFETAFGSRLYTLYTVSAIAAIA